VQGHPRIIDLLNQVLRKVLTGINPYFIQSRIDWIEAQRHKIAEVGHQQYLAQIYA
jgi:bacterioferritin (cytochrome b1)